MLLRGTTMVCGIIGDPVGHSMSPHMQTKAMEKMGFDGVYVPFHVKSGDLENAVRGIVALDIRGMNVTVPHKTAVMQYLDRLTDDARAVGAVNTIINEHGLLTGDNTDVYGFVQGLLREEGVDSFPAKVCIIGAGGAARAVIYGCATRPEVEEICILNRTLPKAQNLATEFSGKTGKKIASCPFDEKTISEVIPAASLVINTTTIGMHPHEDASPVPDPSVFRTGQIVYDIVIPPMQTTLLKEAAARGARTVGGLSMLACQGARSLELWTGHDAPEEFMAAILRGQFRS
ncbi:shikimate dehydrogenase [bacterium]|nr:shikimate dehydrogenase [bacterium]